MRHRRGQVSTSFEKPSRGSNEVLLNRRGQVAEGLDLLPFLFFIVIVVGGISAGAAIFFGAEIDFRTVEANQLVDKIQGCIASEDKWADSQESFYKICKLNENVLENGNYILKVSVDGEESSDLTVGSNFESCDFKAAKRNRHFVRCGFRDFKVDGRSYEVVAGSKQIALKRRVV